MSDLWLHSLHLQGQPRRALFRAARATLRAACGAHTLAGQVRLPTPTDSQPPPPTAAAPLCTSGPATHLAFYLDDGTNLYPLHVGLNTVGRLSDNDVVIRDDCVSRRHCAIIIHSDLRCELHDVASKNGTLLNGHPIPGPSRLQSGDQITLCGRRLTFHIVEAGPEDAD